MAIADLAAETKNFFTHSMNEEERKLCHSFKTEVDKVIAQEVTTKDDAKDRLKEVVPANLEIKIKPISHQEQASPKLRKRSCSALRTVKIKPMSHQEQASPKLRKRSWSKDEK